METSTNIATQPAPAAQELYQRWIQFLDDEFNRHHSPERRAEIVRDQLYQLYLGRPHDGIPDATLTSELPGAVVGLSLDPMNVTMDSGESPEVDLSRYAERKPLLWFWQMFDRSPVGTNHWLGLRFRAMLGRHIFAHMGQGVRIHQGVGLHFGYNLVLEDGVKIHQGALLNDRGTITIEKGAIIGSYARVFSHCFDDGGHARLAATTIGAGARIGSHAIVQAGQHVPAGSMVGEYPAEKH